MKTGRPIWKTTLLRLAQVTAVALLVLSLGAYLAGLHRYFELICHFRLQYLVASGALILALGVLRSWSWAGVMLLGFAVNAVEVLPWYLAPAASELSASEAEPRLRIFHANVRTANTAYPELIELIRAEDPDVICLLEVSQAWLEGLAELAGPYPYIEAVPRNDNFGIAMFSRLPLRDLNVVELGGRGLPSLFARVEIGDSLVSILSTHPPPPVSAHSFGLRNDQLEDAALFLKEKPRPLVVMGDLNTTMWSPYYRRFVKETGLENAARGHGILSTWPRESSLLSIPIDHGLVSGGLSVRSIRVGPPIGSDHLPLIVELELSPLRL